MSNSDDNGNGKKLPVDVKVEVGAKAELKGEIPSRSLGRAVDAVADAFRFWTAPRALKPHLIRLQQEEVAIEIAERARELAHIENAKIQSVPSKFLVPFLEKASLEELESELIDRWAHLLLEASSDYRSDLLVFIDILSRLGPEEIKILESFAKDIDTDDDQLNFLRDMVRFEHTLNIAANALVVREGEEANDAFRRVMESMEEGYLGRKILSAHMIMTLADRKGYVTVPTPEYRDSRISIEILAREGTINIRETELYSGDGFLRPRIKWADITPLGLRFVKSCRSSK